MIFKNQLILALILFIGGGLTYWNEFKRRPEAEKNEILQKRILPIKNSVIQSFKINQNGKVFLFSCDDLTNNLCKPTDPSHWKIENPLKAKGDQENINNTLTSISNWDPSETIDLSKDSEEKRKNYFKDYGLDQTSSSLFFTFKDGSTEELIIGNKHPVQDSFFTARIKNGKKDDSKVYLLPQYQWKSIEHELHYFRDKKIMSLTQIEVNQIEITSTLNQDRKITLLKNNASSEKEGWTLSQESLKLPGDNDSIGTFISGVLFLNAKNIYSENKNSDEAKKVLASSKKITTITLKSEKGNEETLELYERKFKDGKLEASAGYAINPALDPLYEIETTSFEKFSKKFDDLRLTKLIPSMDKFSQHYLFAEKNGVIVELEEKEGEWREKGKEIDPSKVQALLEALSSKALDSTTSTLKTPPKESLHLKIGQNSHAIGYEFSFFEQNGKTFVFDHKNPNNPIFGVLNSVASRLPFDLKSLHAPLPPKKVENLIEDQKGKSK